MTVTAAEAAAAEAAMMATVENCIARDEWLDDEEKKKNGAGDAPYIRFGAEKNFCARYIYLAVAAPNEVGAA